jgi:hypothetical protein
MQRFKSPRQAQRFLSAHAFIYGHFRPRRHLTTAGRYRAVRSAAFRNLEPGDVCPNGSINVSCAMLLPKIGLQLVKLTMPHDAVPGPTSWSCRLGAGQHRRSTAARPRSGRPERCRSDGR